MHKTFSISHTNNSSCLQQTVNFWDKKLWSKYLDAEVRVYSKYSGLSQVDSDETGNMMTQIARLLMTMESNNPTKTHIRNFVKRIIASSDYERIGMALNKFMSFVKNCQFEDKELMVRLFEFLSSDEVPVYQRVLVYEPITNAFTSSQGFKHYAEMLTQLPHNQKIQNKVLAIYRRDLVWDQITFLRHAYSYFLDKERKR